MTDQLIHENQPVLTHGVPLEEASAAVIMLHGRGATAQSILGLASKLPQSEVTYLAPQASDNRWYPHSGFGQLKDNHPHLPSALNTIDNLITQVNAAGIPTEKIVLGGFSQGGCLASEYLLRNTKRYGGIFILSGALMGPQGRELPLAGAFDGTSAFLGGVDQDSWLTPDQLRQTAHIFESLGAEVSLDIAHGSEHTIRPEEAEAVSQIISALL